MWTIHRFGLFRDGVLAVPLAELDGLAGPVAQVIELGPPFFAAADRLDVDDVRRMQREDALDALIVDDPADGEGRVDAPAFARDDRAGEYLRPLFVAFFDPAVDIDDVADLEMRDTGLETLAFNGI
jgi:hypothetical protein